MQLLFSSFNEFHIFAINVSNNQTTYYLNKTLIMKLVNEIVLCKSLEIDTKFLVSKNLAQKLPFLETLNLET